MRLSRWSWSPVETLGDRDLERAALASVIEVVPDDSDAEILVVTSNRRVDARLLEGAPAARLVLTATSGTDHIDVDACSRRGIQVGRCPLARRDPVTEATIGALLWGLRRWGPQQRAAVEGHWIRSELPSLAAGLLAESCIGVVGAGVIGRCVIERLLGWGAAVVATDPNGLPSGIEPATFAEMATRCDAVTLHCELVASTRGLVTASWLGTVRPGLVLVNTARGGLVDVKAASAALEDGRLGALCLDVFPDEPFPGLAELAAHPRALLTPHGAGAYKGLALRVRTELCEAVGQFVERGTVPHPVSIGP